MAELTQQLIVDAAAAIGIGPDDTGTALDGRPISTGGGVAQGDDP